MSGISDISTNLLNSTTLNNQQSTLNQALNSQESTTQSTDAQTQTDTSSSSDIVTLSNAVAELENQTLLDSQSQNATGSDSSLYGILTGSQGTDTSDGLPSDLLFSEENVKLMAANPTLMGNIISEEEAQSSGDAAASDGSSTSQGLSQEALQAIENINLSSINPETLLSLQQQYAASSDSNTQSTAASQINTKA